MSELHQVRPARFNDANSIAAIYTESVLARDCTMDTDATTTNEIEHMLMSLDARECVLVLENGESVMGWGIVKKYSDRPGYRVACETSVYIKRSQTGKGFGSRIQEQLMRFATEKGYRHIAAKIWADNESSIALHRKFGFTLVGIQTAIGEVDGISRDIALMQCVL